MSSKLLFASLATVGLATTASAAHAEGRKVGVQAQILPASSIGGDEDRVDLATAFGVAASVDFVIAPNVDIGLVPRVVFGMKSADADGDDESLSEIDLSARLTVHGSVAPKVGLFGYFAPGVSMILLPRGTEVFGQEIDHPTGLVLGFGGGVSYPVSPTVSLVGEVGYQLGFQSTSLEFLDETRDLDFKSNLVHIGFGVQAAL